MARICVDILATSDWVSCDDGMDDALRRNLHFSERQVFRFSFLVDLSELKIREVRTQACDLSLEIIAEGIICRSGIDIFSISSLRRENF